MSSSGTTSRTKHKFWVRAGGGLVLVLAIVILAFWFKPFSQSKTEIASKSTSNPSSPTPNKAASKPNGNRGNFEGAVVLVNAVKVERRDLIENIVGLGTVTPSETVTVRSQVSGPIVKILFEESQRVKKGDLLFEIDPRPFQAKLNQAQGQLAQSTAQLLNAQQDLKRYQILFKQDSIARQQLDTQSSLVRQYSASQESAKAQVEQAKLDLDYTKIASPISGRIGLRKVDIGNLITANSTDGLTTITQMQPADVIFALPETKVSAVATKFYKNQELLVDILDRSNQEVLAHGRLISMDNVIDTATGTVKLKARFDNTDFHLFPNQFVNTRLLVEKFDQVLSIETDAIQHGKQGAFVFLVQADNTVKMQDLSLGVSDHGYTQVLKGLALGDRVVIEGVDRLREGSKVEIKT